MERRIWGMAGATIALGILPIAIAIVLLSGGVDLFALFPPFVYVLPMVGGMLSVIFAFTTRIGVEVPPDAKFKTTAGLAKGFRLAGFTVVEGTNSVTLTFDKWTAIKLTYDEGGSARLKFRLDATSTTLWVIIILFLLS
jgi:hypothetical protein